MVNAVMNAHHAFHRYFEVFMHVALGAVGDDNQRVERARHFDLHVQKRIPAPFQKFDPRPFGMRDINAAVFGNRVMDGADDGQAHIAHIEHAIAQRLVVMHDVILVDLSRI